MCHKVIGVEAANALALKRYHRPFLLSFTLPAAVPYTATGLKVDKTPNSRATPLLFPITPLMVSVFL